MRGRKPKPTARRTLEGNPGHRPLNAREPAQAVAGPEFDMPPVELEADPRAVAYWARMAPRLRQARQVTEADRGALTALCLEWARYVDATERLRSEKLIVRTGSGYAMPNPLLTVSNRALAACTRLWAELGCTPSSRSRVSLVDDAEPDALDTFLAAPLRIVKR